LNPPAFAGFDGGAGARYQARREVRSFWFPTWLALPAALIEDSKLIDAPAHDMDWDMTLSKCKGYELIILHTSSPSIGNDVKFAEALKNLNPKALIGFIGAHVAVLPEQSLKRSEVIDFVCQKEFEYTIKEISDGVPFEKVNGISYQKEGKIFHNPPRELIKNLDDLPFITNVYKRDVQVEKYYNGYLQHPYLSLYTGRGCPALCTFCLWPQTIGGHRYRTRTPESVYQETKLAKELFPQVKEFFYDDDTLTANLPRAREIAKKIGPLGITWSCNSRANVSYDSIKVMKENGLRLFLVGFESGNQQILDNIKKGVRVETMRKFMEDCKKLGVIVHGTFIMGLPGETRETIQETINFAKELDPLTIQVSIAAPYPGTELYEQAMKNDWFVKGTLVNDDSGFQGATLQYPGLNGHDIFEAVDEFYRKYYFRPKPILRIMKEMVKDRQVCMRRLREGKEFFKFMMTRKETAIAS
jgi:hopanoid biosynthesis associated radical SAM protein HpnJ